MKKTRTVLPSHDKRWWRFPPLARYACWLEALLGEALPEEAVSLASLYPAYFAGSQRSRSHRVRYWPLPTKTPIGLHTVCNPRKGATSSRFQ
jgi:hypothetical protein